ncbi:DUF6660 family protein [Mucilaginibacter hurinus]|uniref:DUF6660 family protein n=1 Tax=Mucilaginibacter hurinus TaxID=2201324 RepID=UPI0011BDB623|nr:DUF6660 family protein [Mucilaginibacter hurinus]
MRMICFLLSLFFLALDLEPCKDFMGASDAVMTTYLKEHHQPEQSQDQCPPMCSCNCCNMQVVFRHQPEFCPVSVRAGDTLFYQIPEKPVNRPGMIWQPPKFSA